MLGDRRKLKFYLDISKIGLGHPEREKIINLSMLNTQTLVPCSILLTLVFVTWFFKTIKQCNQRFELSFAYFMDAMQITAINPSHRVEYICIRTNFRIDWY